MKFPVCALRFLSVAVFALTATGCVSMQPQQFANSVPRFDPIAYFTGPTRSWGVIENRAGDPKSRFRTMMAGRRVGDSLELTQDFTFEDGHARQRIWHLRQVDGHRYAATASDVVGITTGYAWAIRSTGNTRCNLKPAIRSRACT